MNDRMKKLFEECRQLAKDKNINIVIPRSLQTVDHIEIDGIKYLNADKISFNVVKGRVVNGEFKYHLEPGTPMARLKEMNIPNDAFQNFRLNAVAGLVNHGISIDEQMKSLTDRIQAASGNWLKFIPTPAEITPVYAEYFKLYLTKAVYNGFVVAHVPTLAFKLTLALEERIQAVTDLYLEKNRSHAAVANSTVYVCYDTVKTLVRHVVTDEPFDPNDLFFTIMPGAAISLS
ncbi:hypothetical protein SUREIYA_01830 [Serratia phage vB_SmaM-Sureiya]|nr:hypothetical protein SUREIYA_01830 [Serratia phage vB_SmaM-Sureiya]